MKIFASLQELWNYCLICPICQKSCRTILLSVGPDYCFKLNSFVKLEDKLILNCCFHNLSNMYCDIIYNINCLDNSFNITFSKDYVSSYLDEKYEVVIDKKVVIKHPYFYFYFNVNCEKCSNTHLFSDDIELNKDYLYNLAIDREGMYCSNEHDNYYVSYNYIDNNMFVFEKIYKPYTNTKPIAIKSIISIDFSNIDKAIKKIKTLLLIV